MEKGLHVAVDADSEKCDALAGSGGSVRRSEGGKHLKWHSPTGHLKADSYPPTVADVQSHSDAM